VPVLGKGLEVLAKTDRGRFFGAAKGQWFPTMRRSMRGLEVEKRAMGAASASAVSPG
jgi:hypothetical protein